MTRLRPNLLVDIVMLVAFIPALVSGIVLWLVPEGYRGGRGAGTSILIGFTRGEWMDLHTASSLALAALVILHLVLHIPSFKGLGRTIFSRTVEKNDGE